MSKLFVGNLSWRTDKNFLMSCISNMGTVQDAVVMTDHDIGRSRGFGFVTTGSETEAAYAVDNMNEQELDGRMIRVGLAKNRDAGLRCGGAD